MRDDLVGYLIGALDAPDSHRVEALLADPQSGESLRRDLEILRRSMSPVVADSEPLPAPAGLATRTLEMIAARKTSAPHDGPEASSQPSAAPGRPRAEPANDPFRGSFPADHRSRPQAPRHHGRHHRSTADGRPSTMTPERSAGHVGSPLAWLDKVILAATALAACVLVIPGDLVEDAEPLSVSVLPDDTEALEEAERLDDAEDEGVTPDDREPEELARGDMDTLEEPVTVTVRRFVTERTGDDDADPEARGDLLTDGEPVLVLLIEGVFVDGDQRHA